MGIKRFFLNLVPTPFIWLFARPYVAGSSLQEALNKVERLWQDEGIMSTVDLLGEDVISKEEVDSMVNVYLEILEGLKDKSNYASVSLKPTALGVNLSKDLCLENLKSILEKAKKHNILVTMDMEDSPYTTITLNLYAILKPLYPNLGTVLQTRLFRTEEDIEQLPHNSHIRLVIGIYLEPKKIAYQKKKVMKDRLVNFTQLLVKNKHFVAVATHDEPAIEKILTYAQEEGIKKEQIEFQFLLGVPRKKIQEKIINEGYNVRLYVPFATQRKHVTKYAIRRFEENPHMAIYLFRNLWAQLWFKIFALLGVIGGLWVLWVSIMH